MYQSKDQDRGYVHHTFSCTGTGDGTGTGTSTGNGTGTTWYCMVIHTKV